MGLDMDWMGHLGSLALCMLQKTKQKQIDVLIKTFHY